MGTSRSFGGPRDRVPLLPQWALTPQAPGSVAGGGGGVQSPVPQNTAVPTNGQATPVAAPVVPTGTWQAAKTSLGKAAARTRGGGGGGGRGGRARTGMRSAARGYVRARGGSRAAARTSRSGRTASAGLGGFLSDVTNRGMGEALRQIGLSSYEGRDADAAFAAIANALAPSGDSREAAAARQATNQALDQLFQKFVSETGDFSRLEAMTAQDLVDAVQTSVAEYVFNRWVGDLGVKVEQRTVTPAQAVQFERDMRLYVEEAVKLDFSRITPLTFDWRGPAGQAFIERVYTEAYALFGGEQ